MPTYGPANPAGPASCPTGGSVELAPGASTQVSSSAVDYPTADTAGTHTRDDTKGAGAGASGGTHHLRQTLVAWDLVKVRDTFGSLGPTAADIATASANPLYAGWRWCDSSGVASAPAPTIPDYTATVVFALNETTHGLYPGGTVFHQSAVWTGSMTLDSTIPGDGGDVQDNKKYTTAFVPSASLPAGTDVPGPGLFTTAQTLSWTISDDIETTDVGAVLIWWKDQATTGPASPDDIDLFLDPAGTAIFITPNYTSGYWQFVYADADPAPAALVVTCYADVDSSLQLSLQQIDYGTGLATVLQTDTVTTTDARLPGSDPVITDVHGWVVRVSPDTVLVGYGGFLGSGWLNWFGVMHINESGGTFTLGTFLKNYTWGDDEEIYWDDYNVHVLDSTHVLYGGQVRDLTGGARTARWQVLDVSGATPSIAWGYTDATLPSGRHWPQRSPKPSLTAIASKNDGGYKQMLLDVDMTAHTVVQRDVVNPNLLGVEVPNPAGAVINPYTERNQVLLTSTKWASVYDAQDGALAFQYVFVTDQSTGEVTSNVLDVTLPDYDNNYEADATELLVDSRGSMWVLTNQQTDGPLQTMVLVQVELDTDDVVGVNARIYLDSDDAADAFMAQMHRDIYDLGNGVAVAWGKYDSVAGTQALYAGIVSDSTAVFTTGVELIAPVVGPTVDASDLMQAQAVFVGTAIPLPAPVVSTVSSAGIGDQIETTTTTHSTGGSGPKLAIPLGLGPDDQMHPQHHATYTRRAPALIIAGAAVREPLMAGINRSYSTISIPDVSEELTPALSVTLGADWRWLAGPSFHSGGPGFVWDPIFGSRQWSFPAANAPYVDPAFSTPTAHGSRDLPALIFAGDMWGQLGVSPHSQFTMAFVARLRHPHDSGYYDLLSSPNSAVDANHGTDLTLRYYRGRMRAYANHHRYVDHEPNQWVAESSYRARLSRRLTVIVWSMDQAFVRFGMVSGLTNHIVKMRLHETPGSFDTNFFLGRNGAAYDSRSAARMQLYEVAMWRDEALDRRKIRRVLHKLNGVYGVQR